MGNGNSLASALEVWRFEAALRAEASMVAISIGKLYATG
jgi:hypothetical protein